MGRRKKGRMSGSCCGKEWMTMSDVIEYEAGISRAEQKVVALRVAKKAWLDEIFTENSI